MEKDDRQSFVRTGILVAALAAPFVAIAQEAQVPRPEGRVALGFGQTDNLNRDAAATVRSDITRLDLGFAGSVDRSRLRGGLAGDLQFLKYGAEEIADDNEVLGSVDGILELHVVPDRFHWDLLYNYGQTRIDSQGPVGPGNRQRTTIASTGPELALPLGVRNSLELGMRVSDRSYGTTDSLDSRLTTLRLGLVRSIDSVTRVALNLEKSENELKTDSELYKFEIASLEYRRELASGEAIASIGRGRVEIGDESEPTTVARLAWNRAVGARSRLEICAGRELTDAGSVFAGGGGAVGCRGELSGLADVARTTDGRLHGVVLSSSPLRRESVGLRFDVNSQLANFSMSIGAARDRFESDVSFDNDSTTFQISGSRQLGQQWRGEVSLRRWDQDFIGAGTENDDQSASFVLSRSLARNSHVDLSFERNRRVGDQNPFDENVFFLSFGRDFGR